jgi:hypothetical protein
MALRRLQEETQVSLTEIRTEWLPTFEAVNGEVRLCVPFPVDEGYSGRLSLMMSADAARRLARNLVEVADFAERCTFPKR